MKSMGFATFLVAAAASAVLAIGSAQAAPQGVKLKERGNANEQRACTPDVFRLCMGSIPNEPAIVSCLRRSMPQLSAGCRAVFQSKPSKNRRALRRGNAEPMTTGSINRR